LIIEKVPLLLLSFASCVATCLSPETISPSGRWTLAFRVENALASHAAYLRQLFAPTDLAVPYTAASNGIAFWKIAAVLCLVFALTWLAVAQRQKRPYLTVGWLWYLGMSMPVIGLIQISYYARADRYTYLPQIGLAIAIAWLAKDFAARRQLRAVVPVLALAVLAVLALRTRDQVSVWRNDATLWTHTIKVMPGNVYGHNGLGLALANRGRLDEAIWHYREALKSKPDFVQTLNNLGNALLGQKKADEAISCFREALRIQPDLSLSHNNLGNALGEAGKTDEAIAAYREAIRLKQDFAPAYGNLGNALLTQNRVEEAVLAHREALRLQPNGPNRHLNLGTALLKQGNLEEAIFHLTKVLRFGPSAVEAHVSLADAFLQQGRPGEAIALCNDALRIKPDFPEAHYQIGKILSIQGRFQDAMAHYEEALRLRPDYAEAHNNLGNLLATTGQIEPAVSHYEKALQLQPTNVEAHNNLGGLLLQQDRLQDAIAEYESALRLRPSFVPALRNLAWIRAASGNPAFRDANSAIQLARRAVELTDNKDAAALDVLAAALAENRQMDEAVAVATEARQLALAAKQAAMVNQIETRLKLYTNGSPYRLNQ
jgi:Tfp pilus assembly protein PilF